MRTVINPPSLGRLLSTWSRVGVGGLVSFAFVWLLGRFVLPMGLFPVLPFLLLGVILWSVMLVLQGMSDHTLTIEGDRIVLRTWLGALLGTSGYTFALQEPRLTRSPYAGRGGGGVRSTRMWLIDDTGRQQMVTFTLIGFSQLAEQVASSPMGHRGTPPVPPFDPSQPYQPYQPYRPGPPGPPGEQR